MSIILVVLMMEHTHPTFLWDIYSTPNSRLSSLFLGDCFTSWQLSTS